MIFHKKKHDGDCDWYTPCKICTCGYIHERTGWSHKTGFDGHPLIRDDVLDDMVTHSHNLHMYSELLLDGAVREQTPEEIEECKKLFDSFFN